MTSMEPSQRKTQPSVWGTRQMRNARSNVRRYDPGTKDLRTGLGNQEGQSQAPSTIDHGSLSGLGDDDHTQYLGKSGGQMTGVVKEALVVSSAGTLTINNTTGMHVFTGTTTTWTLPAVSGNTSIGFWIKNRGSGAITLNRAGSDNLYDTTTRTSITINAGAAAYIFNDGTYWLVLFNA